MSKLIRLFNTVKYLKLIQLYYRLYYFARSRWRNLIKFHYSLATNSTSVPLVLQPSIPSYTSHNKNIFNFLNLSHTFENSMDWNFSEYGKLWTYNLTYFDYLQQEKMSKKDGLTLINNFIDQSANIKDGLEPFPISLRGINWVKFLSIHTIKDQKINDSLYAQYNILMDNLEYHLLGNHLLENGFSLLFGAYYFQDEKLYIKAKEILMVELNEQILEDGAHFELSPMYHQIMLFRLIDCINLTKHNQWMVDSVWLIDFFEEKAVKMLAWLNAITYGNGDIPLLNDSTNGIAPTTEQLKSYARALGLNHQPSTINHPLTTSGYRKIAKSNYECVIDIGHIGPDYIPGHAHADTFNFELYIDGKPFIVDTGISTYETNAQRTAERSTEAHNIVEVMGTSSSEVWGGFRVADRASVLEIHEEEGKITAIHDGYLKKFGILHTREWQFEENKIIIRDSLNKRAEAVARLHFHPDITEEMIKKHITIINHESRITNYQYSSEFNKYKKAIMMEIIFIQSLEVGIIL